MTLLRPKEGGGFRPERMCGGAAQIAEATIVLPAVFGVLFMLIMLAVMLLEGASVRRTASKYAVIAAREYSCPGYVSLFRDCGFSGNDLDLSGGIPSAALVNTVSSEHRPYRYLTSGEPYSFSILESEMKAELSSAAVKGERYECEITYVPGGIRNSVKVTVTRKGGIAEMLKRLGITTGISSKVSVSASVVDPGEFVRNTDTVCDLTGTLWKRLGIGSEEGSTGDRLRGFFENFTAAGG